jgi:hypothetical protein
MVDVAWRREIHSGKGEAVHFISVVCSVHSSVVVDSDDDNHKPSFSNNMIIVAVVYLDGVNLKEAILDVNLQPLIAGYETRQNLQMKNGLRRMDGWMDANILLHYAIKRRVFKGYGLIVYYYITMLNCI